MVLLLCKHSKLKKPQEMRKTKDSKKQNYTHQKLQEVKKMYQKGNMHLQTVIVKTFDHSQRQLLHFCEWQLRRSTSIHSP